MKATRTLIASALLLAASLVSAQMPAALRDANAPAAGDWAKASAILRAAIECREPLPPVASVLGILGDLFASSVKRQVGIKDYGTIFPGHGGILDRFDSVMFIAPFVSIAVRYFFYLL